MMLRHIGTRYTPWQLFTMLLRARRFAILREDKEIGLWITAIRRI